MKLHVIGSSSQGNCYVLRAGQDGGARLIIECGVLLREIKKALDFDINVCGCLVTHEHKDHAKAAADLIHMGVDVYMSAGTAAAAGLCEGVYLHTLTALQAVEMGAFTVLPFDVQHDAAEPLGFLIEYRPTGEQIVFATDTYYLKYKFSGVRYFILECNYIRELLDENIELGLIPAPVRRRTLQSHFELENVIEFLKASDLSKCQKIVLIHISHDNGDARRMVDEVYCATGIDTEAANAGKTIDLNETF